MRDFTCLWEEIKPLALVSEGLSKIILFYMAKWEKLSNRAEWLLAEDESQIFKSKQFFRSTMIHMGVGKFCSGIVVYFIIWSIELIIRLMTIKNIRWPGKVIVQRKVADTAVKKTDSGVKQPHTYLFSQTVNSS